MSRDFGVMMSFAVNLVVRWFNASVTLLAICFAFPVRIPMPSQCLYLSTRELCNKPSVRAGVDLPSSTHDPVHVYCLYCGPPGYVILAFPPPVCGRQHL